MTIVMVAGSRNLNERLLRHVSTRVNREGSTDYNTITDQDIENGGRDNMTNENDYVKTTDGIRLRCTTFC